MSQQLQISSLFSVFSLVCLCLFARVASNTDLHFGAGHMAEHAQPIVQVLSHIGQ